MERHAVLTVAKLKEYYWMSQHSEWQWCNFFIPIYASCSGRHDLWQGL